MSITNKLVSIGDFFYFKLLEHELQGMETVLDVGCGAQSPLRRINKKFYAMGIDASRPSIQESQKLGIHDKYKVCNINDLSRHFKKHSFDAVIALDVIEHLPKTAGKKFIKDMIQIATKKVIIFTPNGFHNQEEYGNNPYQVHKSGWSTEDFKKEEFKVHGMRGLKFIRGEYATIKYKPWPLWGSIATVSQYPLYFFPKISYQLLAVKTIT